MITNASGQFHVGVGGLDVHTVDTWLIDVGAFFRLSDGQFLSLSNEEKARAAGFVFQRDRERYVAAHTALRHILATYTGTDAKAIAFETGTHGKPSTVGENAGLAFNLSHSGNYALIATTAGQAVGVDVEEMRAGLLTEEISAICFVADERAWLESLAPEERLQGFFRLWTAKEALLKAIGTGMYTSPLRFVATFLQDFRIAFASATDRTSLPWVGYELNLVNGYAACVVVEAKHDTAELTNVNLRYLSPPRVR